jgi:outer membrane protein OmpA-like peptidoglycan-associated protein
VGVLALAWPAMALRAGEESVGTTSANFLKIPAHARPAAMGEAFTAVSDDESALLYNPAGTARALRHQVSATHIEWFQGIGLEHLGGIASLGSLGSLGLGVSWLQVESLVRTERIANGPDPLANFNELGSFRPFDLAIQGVWAWQPIPYWNAGIGTKAVTQSIDDAQGWGFGVDLGMQRTALWGWLDAGLLLQNLGSAINVGGTPFEQPLTVRVGAAGRFWQRRALISTDLSIPVDNALIPAVGAELWVARALALRGGWRGGYASQPTAGLGFRFSIFQLDYAWQPFSELGNTQRVTATMLFGQPGADVEALRTLLGPVGEAAWRMGGFRLKPGRPDAVTAWTLRVLDAKGSEERAFSGAGPAPAKVDWDGRDAAGQALPDGLYRARLEVESDGDMRATALSGEVELDSTPPQVGLQIEPIVVRPDSSGAVLVPARIRIGAQDKHGVGGWKLEIRDRQERVVRSFNGEGRPPEPLVWDGTDSLGRPINSGSTYYFWPFARDELGNWGKGAPQAFIVLLKEIHFEIASDALFETGKADVRISAYQQLKDVKELILKHHQAGTVVDIVGHTDSEPVVRSVYGNNKDLSFARAQAVIKFLVDLLGMDPAILNPVGAGESKPKADNGTPEGRLANRRVEIVIHAKEYR